MKNKINTGSPLAFIVGIIMMTAITEYDRYRSKVYYETKTKQYEMKANELYHKLKSRL